MRSVFKWIYTLIIIKIQNVKYVFIIIFYYLYIYNKFNVFLDISEYENL